MAIHVLPPSTTHLLGSSLVITTSVSLVKELIDNGIDASATSIDVNISPNTVDRIQVRDNGQGIQIEDFDYLGRRAHTSKLRTYQELETKGGQTLGFRGEALASVNSLASVKLVTRTARDPVASLVVLRSGDGGVERQQPWSAPVGTTVHALKLFDNIPVRRQTALKESRKTLLAIRRLLETYALALPHLKLSLKVPGDSHQTWSYSPCSSPNTREAATQIFGHALVAQCIEVTAPLRIRTAELFAGPTWGTLTAFIPKPDAQLGIIKDKGSFISIDSRPILSSRGLGKKIATAFKTRLMGALRIGDSTKSSMSNPFMQLSINCEPGSYDPNVSPLKDEVIMKEEQMLLNCFEELCDQVYRPRESPSRAQTKTGFGSQENGFNARTPPASGQSGEWENGTQGCFVSDTTSTGSKSPTVDVAGSPVDKDELLEALGDAERDKAAAASCNPDQSATELGYQRAHANAQDKDERLDVAANQDTVSVMMRMVSKVNLARTGSNTSDEGSMTGLVPVQVAPRRTTSQTGNQELSGLKQNDSAPARQLKGIGRYFQPNRDRPIEIASDETATFGNLHTKGDATILDTPRQNEIGRQPLGELRDSMLNAGNEDEEEAGTEATLDLFIPELDILPHPNAPGEDLLGLTEPEFHMATGPGPAVSNGHHGHTLLSSRTPPRSVRRGQQRVRGLLEMSPVEGFTALQTPPSSGTLSQEQIRNTRQSVAVSNNVFSTRFQIPSRTAPRQTESIAPDDGRRQTTLPFVSGLRGQDGERKVTGPWGREILVGGGLISSHGAMNPYMKHKMQGGTNLQNHEA